MTSKLQQARAEFERLTAEYGAESFMNAEKTESTQRHLKTAQKQLTRHIREAFDRIVELERKRKTVPARIPVNKAVGEDIVKLDPERKLLTNLIKMVAYQAESDLVHLIAPHYKRAADEGRTLIQSALAGPADIEVHDDELRVSIAPLSSPHRTRAIAAVCQKLNLRSRIFPGSRLYLKFAISSPKTTMERTVS